MTNGETTEELARDLDGIASEFNNRTVIPNKLKWAAKLLRELQAERDRLHPLMMVCICGSTRFADEHAIARWELEKDGRNICLMINYLPQWWADCQGWEGNDHFGEITGRKDVLDELHKRKIDMADWVLVIAPEGYIGNSTQSEIEYAQSLGKPIAYVESGIEAAQQEGGG